MVAIVSLSMATCFSSARVRFPQIVTILEGYKRECIASLHLEVSVKESTTVISQGQGETTKCVEIGEDDDCSTVCNWELGM